MLTSAMHVHCVTVSVDSFLFAWSHCYLRLELSSTGEDCNLESRATALKTRKNVGN